MKHTLLTILAALSLTLAPASLVTSPAYAAPSCGTTRDAQGQVLQGIGQTGNNCDDAAVDSALRTAVKILSIIAGIAGVIMVIVGGFKYITSGGESGKVANAKNTLIYALVGLFVAALAQLLVHFVLHQTATL